MQLIKDISTLAHVPALLKLKKGLKPRSLDVLDSPGARLENNAQRYGQRSALIFEGQELTWDDPVQIAIFDSLIVFVLLDIKSSEVIPPKSHGILETL